MKIIDGRAYLDCREVAERLNQQLAGDNKHFSVYSVRAWADGMNEDQSQLVGRFRDPVTSQFFFRQTAIERMIVQLRTSPNY